MEQFYRQLKYFTLSAFLDRRRVRQTHSQTIVGEEAGDMQASFNGVRFGLRSWKQRVQMWNFGVRQLRLRLRADVKILSLESCESPQAVTDLGVKVRSTFINVN